MSKFNELIVDIKAESWKIFIQHMVNISALCKDPLKVEFKKDIIRIYSVVKSGSTFMAFKDIIMDNIFKVDEDFSWIIFNPNEVKKLFAELTTGELKLKFLIRSDIQCMYKLIASDEKFEVQILGGDPKIVSTIPMKAIDEKLEEDSLFETTLGEDILKKIQNLSKTKSESDGDKLTDVISIEFLNNDVIFGDSRWKIKLGKTTNSDEQFFFKKTYLLKTLNKSINVEVYDKFLIIKDNPYRILVVLELNSK